jgi:hypothetical protein
MLVIVDEIHFVDGNENVADAKERGNAGVTARLGEHTFTCIDKYNGERSSRGPGGHVSRVLFVAGGVGDDEFAIGGGKVAIRDVDRNSLLTFCAETISKKREIEVFRTRRS